MARTRGTTFAKSKDSAKYSDEIKAAVRRLLSECSLPRDALPYTDEFTRLKIAFRSDTGQELADAEFWQCLSSIGKGGGLARKGARKSAPRTKSLSTEDQLEILRLFPDGIGDRDRLPYTHEFDDLHKRFVRLTKTSLTKHEFWRAVSRVAKLSRKPKPIFESAPLGGLAPDVVQYLERTNPWWRGQPPRPEKRFRRWAFEETVRRLEAQIAPAVATRGPRQVGKSTVQRQLVEHLLLIERLAPERILRVEFEETPGLGALANPVEAIVRWYEENVLQEPINAVARRGDHVYLLFDELQNLLSWSPQLKSLVDNVQARTLVTGSSALRIARGRDSLAGRISTIELGPLRLHEIAGIRSLGDLAPFKHDAPLEEWSQAGFWLELADYADANSKVLRQSFKHFSALGGYPICHNVRSPDVGLLRSQIVNIVVERTIEHDPVKAGSRTQLSRRGIRETFRLLCRYAGQHVKPTELSRQIGKSLDAKVRNEDISAWIQFLVDSMLIHQIPPLELLKKKQTSPMKYCLCDHFVRSAWLQETVPLVPAELAELDPSTSGMAGHIIESIIGYYLMGISDVEVAWFPARRDEPEVDFVLTIGVKRIPVEVKYQRGTLRPGDLKGLRSFCSKPHYGAEFGLVITQDHAGRIADNIIAVPAAALLLLR